MKASDDWYSTMPSLIRVKTHKTEETISEEAENPSTPPPSIHYDPQTICTRIKLNCHYQEIGIKVYLAGMG